MQQVYYPHSIHQFSTIFKTITDESTLSGQKIVGALQARKIAQQQATAQLETDIACLKQYEIACQGGFVSTEQFDSIMKKASMTAKEYTANIKAGTGSAQSYAQSQKANNAALQSVGIGAGIASKAVKALSVTMNTIAITAFFTIVSKGISWITEQINNYIHRNEIAIEEAEKLLDTFKSEVDAITSNQDKINGYASEFRELSEGVDDLGRNVSLTADEYSRYQSIVKEIVSINPSLISGYDEENNILVDKNGLIETSIQLLKDEYNQKLKNLALPDNVDTTINGAIGKYNSAKEDFLNVTASRSLGALTQIDKNGNIIKSGMFAPLIGEYIEDVIGVEFTGWEGGINQYILNNAEAVFNNLDKIKERAAQTKDGWEGLNDSQLIDLMDYFKELRIAYNDMNNATTSANPTLQYVAMAEDSYSELSDIQKKFVADYINGIHITSETTEQEKDNIRKSIISLTQELSNLDDPEINNALADLYAIPTDEQSVSKFVEQFRSALEIIKAYCKENGIEIPIAIADSEKEINDLEALYKSAVYLARYKFNSYDPTDFFKEHSINTQEEIDKWQKIAKGARDAAEAEMEYLNQDTGNSSSTSFTGFTEVQSKSIDDFQSRTNTLSTALSALRSGEDVGMTELLEQFPELAGQSENLEDAIITLIYDSLDKLYGVLGEGLPDEVRQNLQSIADTASGVIPDLNTAFASIRKSYDAMHEFKDAMDTGGLTEAILSNVGLLSPYMNQLVAQFHSGTISADELYQALTEHYHTDLANYGNALIAKNLMSEEFYNAVGLTNDEVINSFFNNYGVDIRNCKNYNQAKLAIEQQTLNTLGDMWKQYYNVQADAYTDDLAKLGDMAAHGDQEAQKKIVELQKQVDAYRKAMEALDNITYEGIEEDFDKITSGLNNKSSSSIQKETEEIFDFIAVKIENLEKQISRLEETASDASKSLKKRQQAYTDALSATTSEIGLQQQAYQKYMEKANSFGLSEEWAQKVRDGSLDISSVTDDALKQQIKSYQEWYKKALECSDSLDGLKKKLRELETARIQLEIDVKSNDLDKLESLYDKIENRISLSELFGGKASSSKYEALNKNLQKQIINLDEQNDLIAKQAKLVTKGSEAWQEYQKSINDNESSICKLMQTIAENAKTMAELTNEKTSDRIAGYDSKDDYYSAKADNAAGYKTKNRYLNKEATNIQKRLDAYENADTENKKALSSAASAVGKLKKNSSNRELLNEAKKYTRSKKEIPASLLEKAAALNDGGILYTAFVNYNAALAAYETGRETHKLYEETARQEKAKIALEKFRNIESYYENKQNRYSGKAEKMESEKSMAEAEGRTESTKYYKRLASNEEKKIASLMEEREKLTASLEKAAADGTVKKGSDEWYEMKRAIDSVTDAIDKSKLSLKEYENAIRQIQWDRFDTLQSKISRLASEMDFLIKELSRSSLTSPDTGGFTDEGKAVSALHASKYTAYTEQAKLYKKEIDKINKELAEDPYNQDLVKQKEELYDAHQQVISATQDEKASHIDLLVNVRFVRNQNPPGKSHKSMVSGKDFQNWNFSIGICNICGIWFRDQPLHKTDNAKLIYFLHRHSTSIGLIKVLFVCKKYTQKPLTFKERM